MVAATVLRGQRLCSHCFHRGGVVVYQEGRVGVAVGVCGDDLLSEFMVRVCGSANMSTLACCRYSRVTCVLCCEFIRRSVLFIGHGSSSHELRVPACISIDHILDAASNEQHHCDSSIQQTLVSGAHARRINCELIPESTRTEANPHSIIHHSNPVKDSAAKVAPSRLEAEEAFNAESETNPHFETQQQHRLRRSPGTTRRDFQLDQTTRSKTHSKADAHRES